MEKFKNNIKMLKQVQHDNVQGRSMVEMLGVLAIIGVLSAGALAGYSKAMFMHKMNQCTDAFTQLLQNCMMIAPKLEKDTTKTTYYTDTLKAANMIPNGFSYYDSTYLQDMFYNKIKPTIKQSYYGITYHFSSTDVGQALCRQIIITLKGISNDLYYIYSDNGESAARGEDHKATSSLYGDSYCGEEDKPCLKNTGISEMNDICAQCDYSECRVLMYWF
ncbi:MAG: hypothetical protein J6X42_05970 [Alphaproteobacteria bacterium]|nr:hypothetical protein [Alphaproteobacteria bacterium]